VAINVAAAGFDAIVEAPPLHIAEPRGRRIPATPVMVRMILTVSWRWGSLGRAVLGDEQNGCSQGKNKRWKYKSN
jgi:hypothetical protein